MEHVLDKPPRLVTVLDRGKFIGTISKGILRDLLCAVGVNSEEREGFIIVILDKDNYVVTSKLISIGGPRTVLVSLRDTFREAVSHEKWTKVVVSHNHPDGNPTPSNEDRSLTESLKTAGKLLGVEIVDHIVIGDDTFFSFADGQTYESDSNVIPLRLAPSTSIYIPSQAREPTSISSPLVIQQKPLPPKVKLKAVEYKRTPHLFPPKPTEFVGHIVWWNDDKQQWERTIQSDSLVGRLLSWL